MISNSISYVIPPQMKTLTMVIRILMHIFQSPLKLERCKLLKAARRPKKCGVINYLKLFRTVYRRLSRYVTLQRQMYKNAILLPSSSFE